MASNGVVFSADNVVFCVWCELEKPAAGGYEVAEVNVKKGNGGILATSFPVYDEGCDHKEI